MHAYTLYILYVKPQSKITKPTIVIMFRLSIHVTAQILVHTCTYIIL